MNATRSRDRGLTLLEVIFSIAIFSVVAVAAAEHIGLSWSYTSLNRDRIFAYRKAQSLLAELQAYVDRGDAEVAADLDRFDNGIGIEDTLTITDRGEQHAGGARPSGQSECDHRGRAMALDSPGLGSGRFPASRPGTCAS